jgi:hypothetical protein
MSFHQRSTFPEPTPGEIFEKASRKVHKYPHKHPIHPFLLPVLLGVLLRWGTCWMEEWKYGSNIYIS